MASTKRAKVLCVLFFASLLLASVFWQIPEMLRKQGSTKGTESGDAAAHSGRLTGIARDSNGFRLGAVLALGRLSKGQQPLKLQWRQEFTIRIPLNRRPGKKINPAAVRIQVFLYDEMKDGNIVETNGYLWSHWEKLPADWKAESDEVLEVHYAPMPPTPNEAYMEQHYYGYVVCVYYNGVLQDEASEPVSIIDRFPAPLRLAAK